MMKRLLIGLLTCLAAGANAGALDVTFDSGTIATAGSYAVLSGPISGPIKQVDVYLSATSAVTVDVVSSATNGAKVAKTILSSGSIVASRSFRPRALSETTAGASITSNVPVEIWMADDRLLVTISNKSAAVTTSAKVTIIRGGE